MTRTAWVWIIIILAIVILGWVVLAGDQNDEANTTGEEQVQDEGSLSGLVVGPNAVNVDEQPLGNKAVVSMVVLEAPGYVVIHESNNGAPGRVLGASTLLQAGESKNVNMNLSSALAADKEYIAMLHVDNGDGTFSETADLTAKNGNDVVMMEFEASADAEVNVGGDVSL